MSPRRAPSADIRIRPRCAAMGTDGRRCGMAPVRGGRFCYAHDPTIAEERTAARRRGAATSNLGRRVARYLGAITAGETPAPDPEVEHVLRLDRDMTPEDWRRLDREDALGLDAIDPDGPAGALLRVDVGPSLADLLPSVRTLVDETALVAPLLPVLPPPDTSARSAGEPRAPRRSDAETRRRSSGKGESRGARRDASPGGRKDRP